MLNKNITRREFLKDSASLALMSGIFCASAVTSAFAETEPVAENAPVEKQVKRCYNSCTRNCYDTCSIITTVEDGVVRRVEGNPNNTFTNGRLCVKGNTYPRRIYSPDRIKYPMKQNGKGTGNWERISWDEAYDMIAHKILAIKEKHGNLLPLCLNKYSGNFNVLTYGIEGFMSSLGHTTRCQGTPCWPAGIDAQTFDMGTLLNSDPENMVKSKYILVWGANPAWNTVHTMNIIQKARENGAKVVVIDPILTDTAAKADLYIEIKAGTDAALALGMAKRIVDTGKQDTAWMEANSIGYQEFIDYLNSDITVEWAAEKTGLTVEQIENLADEYAAADPACLFIGFGLQRHTNGGATVRALDALAALTGNIGKVGGGANYGQLDSWGFNYACMGFSNEDNVDADRNININNFAAEVLNADPKIEMLWIACRNPMSQDAETAVEIEAFKSVDFVVTVDQFMTPSVEWSDLVLPVCTIFENWGLAASYWHYWMNGNEPAIEELYESKTDIEIGMGVSKRMNELVPGSCTYPTDKPMKEWAADEMTDGFKEMFGFQSWEEIFEKGTAKVTGYDAAWADGNFRTPSGKYEFYSETAASFGNHLLPVYVEEFKAPEGYPIRLLSPHWKYSLHSQFQNLDWMRDIHDEPFAEIGSELAAAKGISDGDMIRVFNDRAFVTVRAHVTETAPKDSIVIYEAWYKGAEFNVNYLVKATPADMGDCATGQPGIAYHDCFVDIEKA